MAALVAIGGAVVVSALCCSASVAYAAAKLKNVPTPPTVIARSDIDGGLIPTTYGFSSANKKFNFLYQPTSGNLKILGQDGTNLWNMAITAFSTRANMQENGVVAVYKDDVLLWTGTIEQDSGKAPYSLILSDTGVLAVRDKDNIFVAQINSPLPVS